MILIRKSFKPWKILKRKYKSLLYNNPLIIFKKLKKFKTHKNKFNLEPFWSNAKINHFLSKAKSQKKNQKTKKNRST